MTLPSFLQTAGLYSLREHAVLRVHGDDARSWLNGQITNDVRATTKGQSVYALVINLKGRVVADVWVLDNGDDFLLVLPQSAFATVEAQFEKYIIMEDVALSAASELRVVTLQGALAASLAEKTGVSTSLAYRADRMHAEGVDILIAKNDYDAAWENLSAAVLAEGGEILDDVSWQDARIGAGRPAFGVDFGERTYPQEAGLEERAVSFNKGCYLGQEVVCMLENRGQLTRRLVALTVTDKNGLTHGTQVTGSDGANVGEVTSVSSDQTRALAFVRRALANKGTEVNAGGERATVEEVL
ncbi:MAG: folate-binding protein YgfZ [Sandaracinaceae bacterium]|nr:folate-binding protein YgfZ [Sandaracinaceae bacterium]